MGRRGHWSRNALGLLAATGILLLAATPAVATSFQATITVEAWDEQVDGAGLDIEILDVTDPLAFSLNPGESTTPNLFRIRTPQAGAVNGDDLDPKPITVTLDFVLPFVFSVELTGVTRAGDAGTGNIAGFLLWDALPQDVNFGPFSDGVLQIDANDRIFNEGFLGLNNPGNPGTFVPVQFRLAEEATIPEPGTASLMLFAGTVAALMRRLRQRG